MPVSQEHATGVFHHVQQFIEGVSSLATSTSSALPSSLAWLRPSRRWVVVAAVICISQVTGRKGLWVG